MLFIWEFLAESIGQQTEVSEKHDYWKEEDRIIGVLADNMNFDNKNAENEPK